MMCSPQGGGQFHSLSVDKQQAMAFDGSIVILKESQI